MDQAQTGAEWMEEQAALEKTLSIVRKNLLAETGRMDVRRREIVQQRRDLWEDFTHRHDDFEKLVEQIPYLDSLSQETRGYDEAAQRVRRLERMLDSPYFARIDFQERGFSPEKIHIGRSSLTDEETLDIYVYDWRAPISSIFYRFESGEASYEAPQETVRGTLLRKRQYEIQGGTLRFFFDANVNVMDDILRRALGRNASPHMKNIVETIQREQDYIIRNMDAELLIVQGVAGSGKTSVALHRVAYLLYQNLSGHLSAHQILLLSPNALFGSYISTVLPELGEENIRAVTFEDLFAQFFPDGPKRMQARSAMLEQQLTAEPEQQEALAASREFKLSEAFVQILDRYLRHYEHHMIPFADVMCEGATITTREELKSFFLFKEASYMPTAARLSLVEEKLRGLLEHPSAERLKKIRKFVEQNPSHAYETDSYSRLLAAKRAAAVSRTIHSFTRLDPLEVYRGLFTDDALFARMAKGLVLPDGISGILSRTRRELAGDTLPYADAMAVLYLKIRMEGCADWKEIRQVVVDETQDYAPLHFHILSRLFPSAKYTMLGDISQTIERKAGLPLYSAITAILHKKNAHTAFLTKSFRSSCEITAFASRFAEESLGGMGFERHADPPRFYVCPNESKMERAIAEEIMRCKQMGFGSIAVLCKTMRETQELFSHIGSETGARIVTGQGNEEMAGVLFLPVYLAKGLEFDAVLGCHMEQGRYSAPDDRRILYILCTRALHSLSLFSAGEPAPLFGDLSEYLQDGQKK